MATNSTTSARRLLGAVAVLTLAGAGLSATPAYAADTVDLNLLAITDLHGHIKQETDRNGQITEPGAPLLGCAIDLERADKSKETTLVSVGDNIGGSAYISAVSNDEPTIAVLNVIKPEVSALGNHELDKGSKAFADRLAGRNGHTKINFPVIAANVTGLEGMGKTHVWTSPSGIKVGFVGALTNEIGDLVNPEGIKDLKFTDLGSTINSEAKALKQSGKADIVVALAHEDAEIVAKQMSKDVDVVLAGHTHRDFVNNEAEGKDGNKLIALEAASFGKALGKISLKVDKATKKLVSGNAKNIDTAELLKVCADKPNKQLEEIVKAAEAKADKTGNNPVATINGSLLRATVKPGVVVENRGAESNMNNLIAEATRQQVSGADIGLMNAGGLREDLIPNEKGELTLKQAFTAQPFGGSLSYSKMSGAQFKKALEQQWKKPGENPRPFLKLGLSKNVTYTFDPSAEYGKHVIDIFIDGKHIDDNKIYKVAGNSFIMKGGDGFTELNEKDNEKKTNDTGIIDLQATIDYLKSQADSGNVVSTNGPKQTLGLKLASTEALPGGNLVLDLSSLAMTSGEAPKEVKVEFNGQTVSAPVQTDLRPSKEVLTDQYGTAKVVIPVDAGLKPGFGYTAKVTIPATKTTAESQFTVPVAIREGIKRMQPPTQDGKFKDVNALTLYSGQIYWLKDTGITTGWADGTFQPLANIQRQAMAAFLYRLAGSPKVPGFDQTPAATPEGKTIEPATPEAPAAPQFKDVQKTALFAKQIAWLRSTGITTGWADGTFRPTDPVNRDAMAAFLYRFCGQFADKCAPVVNPERFNLANGPHFKDTAGELFAKQISWVNQAKISTGWNDGTFRPSEPIHRDAMAAFLYRLTHNTAK
ncbi:hypothetical protein BK816_07615 [Boudabousia tangfeifanii]|uniref:SLH domain-containing protein n=1 Tax=Boudabousia tangfeifanii TaxID=1912795 RepID=A0A1D9MLK8_9ACTO|nr:5'-nucleotidase C-terminal domain-containing protein [Boudabousia tangfeifanii]AOZ73176.1 hypothetical protein BK816_07615 [Boudabousia tangfeifanii]